ncbi:MAG TPA: HlyD family efflux transporter periplasmic adaptor subunit [Candidatus Saccharimonadales bacterium]|nr:HlyD family efflux transporter periplasmic adaptor subunit [Candidatus Saccharimonadales bacterium]
MKKKTLPIVIGAAAVVLLGLGAAYSVRQFGSQEKIVPTTRVQRGTLELDIHTTGELRSPHSAMLVAPAVNGTLQIVHIARTGSTVKAGDVIVEFDPSEQEYNLEQSRSQMEEAGQEIVKAKADAAVKEAEDKVALLKARFDVRRAELEVGRNELAGDIDARKNLLVLEQARRQLEQLQQDIVSRSQSSASGLALLQEKRRTAVLGMKVAQHNIENMTVKAPIDGLVAIKDNLDASGGMMFPGMTLPEYHDGDLVFSGRFLAEVLDVGQMEVVAKIFETDRANLDPGQTAEIRADSGPQSVLAARVKHIAGMTARADFDAGGVRRFEVTFDLLQRANGVRPGTTAQVLVRGSQMKDQLYLPSQCLHEKDGKLVVYLKRGDKFEPTEVKIKFRTENRVAVADLKEGAEVALVDPVQFHKQQQSGPSSSPLGVGQ